MHSNKFFRNFFAGIGFLAALGICTSSIAEVPESDEPIKVVVNDWTGQHLSAAILTRVLTEMGYNIENVQAGTIPQLAAMAQGELHVQPEFWTNNISDAYTKGLETGDIITVGQLGLMPQEGWIYPPYMEEMCPGLPSYQALYDCAQAFGTADTFPKGRLVTYPADWGTRSRDVVELIGLPFATVPGGSEGAMVAEMKAALAAKQPMLMMFWQPHWMFAVYDLNWVTWNPSEGNCADSAQETSQMKENACGFEQASVDKIISGTTATTWPAAVKLIDAFTLTNAEHNYMINEVDENKRSLDEVVQEWMDKNKEKWEGWIASAKM